MRMLARRVAAVAAIAMLALLGLTPGIARAADGDVINAYTIDYVVNDSGVVSVTATIDYQFGPGERRGIFYNITTREPDPDRPGQDMVFPIKNVRVESPTGAPTQTSEEDFGSGRDRTKQIRIGDPNRTVDRSETYIISYEVEGAIRPQDTFDEFYWDAIAPDPDAPPIRDLTISARVPGGARDASCFIGAAGSKQTCPAQVDGDDIARFDVGEVPGGDGITIGVMIGQGLVADNQPHWEPDGSQLTPSQLTGLGAIGAAFAVVAVGSPLIGRAWWRRNGRDERFVGLPPGTVPTGGSAAAVAPTDPKIQIPVAFAPPKIPVGEGGYVIDGKITGEETAATLVDLAVRGAVRIRAAGPREYDVELVDPAKMATPEDRAFLPALFPGLRVGDVIDLGRTAALHRPSQALDSVITSEVHRHGWFKTPPRAGGLAGIAVLIFAVVAAVIFLGPIGFLAVVLLAPPLITVMVINHKLGRGVRTAAGRAVTDQVEGFRTYLATAEARQLRFEEGQDIFSRYLPWAIVFNLADRWQGVCEEAMKLGVIPQYTPTWYVGSPGWGYFNAGLLAGSMQSASAPPPPPPSTSSGSGFGSGGSSFGGGGFSGGGGGGASVGSW